MFAYKLSGEDRIPLKAHFEFLRDLPPWKISELTPVDVALERYEAAIGPSRNIEEVLLYAILGIEALFRLRETSRRPFTRRVGKLIEMAGLERASMIEERVDRAYEYRNPFVHGEALRPAQVGEVQSLLEPLLDCLRICLLFFLGLSQSKEAVLRSLDATSSHRDAGRLGRRLKEIAGTLQLGGGI